MAQRYPPEMKEAIWASMCAQVRPTVILERLRAGELDGYRIPTPIPDSTFWQMRRAMKQRRGDPVTQIAAGQEQDLLGETERLALAAMHEEVRHLRNKQRAGEHLTYDENRSLALLNKTIATLSTQAAKARSQSQPSRASAASRGKSGRGQSVIDRLVRDAKHRYGDEATNHANHSSEPNGTMTSEATHDSALARIGEPAQS